MKKLLLILLILPKIAFSETWRCVDDRTSEEFNFERTGGGFEWLSPNSDTLPYPIIKESHKYILIRKEFTDKAYASTGTMILNKNSQTFSLVIMGADYDGDGVTDDHPSSSSGSCDVYEGKKVEPYKKVTP